jgi:hypothetical protein
MSELERCSGLCQLAFARDGKTLSLARCRGNGVRDPGWLVYPVSLGFGSRSCLSIRKRSRCNSQRAISTMEKGCHLQRWSSVYLGRGSLSRERFWSVRYRRQRGSVDSGLRRRELRFRSVGRQRPAVSGLRAAHASRLLVELLTRGLSLCPS